MATLEDRMAWTKLSACRDMDPDIFFPSQGGDTRTPKAICAGCPVREECLEFGINEKWGIWGGTATVERRNLRRARRGAAAA